MRDKADKWRMGHMASMEPQEKLDWYTAAGNYIKRMADKKNWSPEEYIQVCDMLGIELNKAQAAEDLIRARDSLRELQAVGKAKYSDVARVKDANKAYTQAQNK